MPGCILVHRPEEVRARSRKMHAWATVHHSGLEHLPHTHPNHMISGVYYVKVPKDAAPIIFSDPRGRFPPFDDTITIKPHAGDLVLFPSWLTHQVPATPGSLSRISIAFNTPGDWAATTGVSAMMPLDLS